MGRWVNHEIGRNRNGYMCRWGDEDTEPSEMDGEAVVVEEEEVMVPCPSEAKAPRTSGGVVVHPSPVFDDLIPRLCLSDRLVTSLPLSLRLPPSLSLSRLLLLLMLVLAALDALASDDVPFIIGRA